MWGLCSALLAAIALPPVGLPVAGAVSLVPLLLHAQRHGAHGAALQGTVFGTVLGCHVYLGALGYELRTFIAAVALTTLLCAAAAGITARLSTRPRPLPLLLVPPAWVLVELAAEQAGLPFSFALLLSGKPAWLAPAALGGHHLVTLLLVAFQILLARSLGQAGSSACRWSAALLAAVISMASTDTPPMAHGAPRPQISVAVMQTDIPPRETAAPAARNALEQLAARRTAMARRATGNGSRPDLLIWPEIPFGQYEFRLQDGSPAAALARQLETAMLVAAPDLAPDGALLNAVFSIAASGRVLHRHVKQRNIPFLENAYGTRPDLRPHRGLPGLPGSLVCFEAAFDAVPGRLADAGAGFLVVAGNDAYAGPSFLSLLHREMVRLRAVETGRTTVLAANGGPSAIIGPDGTTRAGLERFHSGHIIAAVEPRTEPTLFTRHRLPWHALFWLAGMASILTALVRAQRRKGGRRVSAARAAGTLLLALASLPLCLAQSAWSRQEYLARHLAPGDRQLADFVPELAPEQNDYSHLRAGDPDAAFAGALAYLLRSHGLPETRDSVTRRIRLLSRTGTVDPDIETLNASYGFGTMIVDREALPRATPARPALAELHSGETVAVRAYDAERVLLFSPLRGRELAIRTPAFLDAWRGKLLFLVTPARPWDGAPG